MRLYIELRYHNEIYFVFSFETKSQIYSRDWNVDKILKNYISYRANHKRRAKQKVVNLGYCRFHSNVIVFRAILEAPCYAFSINISK